MHVGLRILQPTRWLAGFRRADRTGRKGHSAIGRDLERLEGRQLLSTIFMTPDHTAFQSAGSMAPLASVAYTPAQIRQAYGFNQITFRGGVQGNGAGQTIAIVDAYDDPNVATDLAAFDKAFAIPAPPSFTKVNQTGGTQCPAGNAGWAVEISLDVEWAHAIAPGSKILLVETTSNAFTDLLAGVNYARRQPGVAVVSMSFGGAEFAGETAYDSSFTTPSGHTGVTFVASSGDDGAPASYPNASPNVLSVGGTSLSLTAAGAWSGEVGWSGSGGGISASEHKPSYQSGVTQSATMRTAPDVAYDANPASGFWIDDTYQSPGWSVVGGTSAGSPQWAALIAIADQGRVLAGLGALDGPSQTLPAIYQMPASNFHDITVGNNGYPAGVGYDLVTGRGSPIANLVVANLAATPGTPTPTPVSSAMVAEIPGSGVWRFEDSTGWQQLTPTNATIVSVDSKGDVAGEFPGSGVWRYEDSIGWQQLTPSTATSLEIAGAGNVVAEIAGIGVWRYEDSTGWQRLTSTNAAAVGIDSNGDVAGVFSGGVWRYEDSTGWKPLFNPGTVTMVEIADAGNVVAEIAGIGVWRYEDSTGWQRLTSTNAAAVGIDSNGDVAGVFSGGVWRYEDSTGWKQLFNPGNVTMVGIDSNGDIAGEVSGLGMWRYEDSTGWKRLTPTNASAVDFA